MIRRVILTLATAVVLATPILPGESAADVRININLPGTPQIVAVPASPVAYIANADANLFFYGGEYFLFWDGVWYVSPIHSGPWVLLEPEFIPRPVLIVPVQFYRRPPPAWRAWRHDVPPRWEPRFGQRWQERRHEGRASSPQHERRDEGQASPRTDGGDRRREDVRPERREEPRGDRREEVRPERREEPRGERKEERREERRDDRRDRR